MKIRIDERTYEGSGTEIMDQLRQQTFYAFRIDTSRYRYYLRLFPQKRKFHLFCYQTDQFREGRPEPNFNLIYRGKPKKKQKSGKER